jgi:aromatic amino acid aminotransferase I
LYKLLDEHWGHEGYLDWLIYIRLQYTARRNIMLAACEEHLPKELCRWKPPMAGMFHWIEIDWKRHPLAEKVKGGEMSMAELEDRIWLRVIDEGTLLIKGSWFQADQSAQLDKLFFRGTYAAAKGEQIVEAVRRVGAALREEFGMEKANGHADGHA